MMGDKSAILAPHRERARTHACMGFYEVALHCNKSYVLPTRI